MKDPIRSHPVLADSHLLRLRRRRLGEASGIVGTTAKVGGLGARLGGHCECWCEVGDIKKNKLKIGEPGVDGRQESVKIARGLLD